MTPASSLINLLPGLGQWYRVELENVPKGPIRLDAVFAIDKDGNVYWPRVGPLARVARWWWWTFGKVE